MVQLKDVFLAIVAAYAVYKIGWVDGFTAVNLFLVLAISVAVVYTVLQRIGAAQAFEEKKRALAMKKEEEEKSGRCGGSQP